MKCLAEEAAVAESGQREIKVFRLSLRNPWCPNPIKIRGTWCQRGTQAALKHPGHPGSGGIRMAAAESGPLLPDLLSPNAPEVSSRNSKILLCHLLFSTFINSCSSTVSYRSGTEPGHGEPNLLQDRLGSCPPGTSSLGLPPSVCFSYVS